MSDDVAVDHLDVRNCTPIVAVLLVLAPLVAGCDAGNAAAAPGDAATAPTTSPASIRPTTGPTTRSVRVPAFPPDGLYYCPTHTLRVAMGGRERVAGLIDTHLADLKRGYAGDPNIKQELLALQAEEATKFVGAAVLLEGPKGEERAVFYFLGKRDAVYIEETFLRRAAVAAGREVRFDPMTHISHYLYRVLQSRRDGLDDEEENDDAAGRKPAATQPAQQFSYLSLMSAGKFALALRVGDRFSAPKVSCLLFEDKDLHLLMDMVTLANLPTTRPMTQPAAREMMP